MHEFPDFSDYNYQVKKELGHNRAGGRVTYLAVDTRIDQVVVIKQFQFAKSGSSWQGYDAYDREIQLLKELNHPGIPRYLDTFQTEDGFCMVQEYKSAASLSDTRSFNPDQIKQIAIAALEILVYLQNRIPPVIHRDIKPDNILVNEAGAVFLVDFGFAHVGEGEVGVSSVVKGTLGFMPPEQLFNRQLTEASDLYGLGMTLICLLTDTKTDRIGDLVDISYRVSFKHLVPKLNVHWVNWLEKMVEPRLKDRFLNAVTALAAIPVSPLRPPEVHFSQAALKLTANRTGAVLTQAIELANPIPETTLEGQWEVAHHPHDPVSTDYRWITVEPSTFSGNQTTCQITVDTRKLMAGKTYNRRLLLQANTLAKSHTLDIQIQTARIAMPNYLFAYRLLGLLGVFFTGLSWLTSWFTLMLGTVAGSIELAEIGTLMGIAIGLECIAWLMRSSGWQVGVGATTSLAVLIGGIVFVQVLLGSVETVANPIVLLGAGLGVINGAISGLAISVAIDKVLPYSTYIPKLLVVVLSLVTVVLGISLGLGFSLGMTKAFVLIPLIISATALLAILAQTQLRQVNLASTRKKSERFLIKP